MYDKTPLSHLLEVAVQKTYHELYTMVDLYVLIDIFSFIWIPKMNLILVYQAKII